MPLFSGQGKVYTVERLAGGAKGKMRWLGNVPALSLSFETDVLEHKESYSGQRVTDARLLRENKANVSLTLDRFDKDNLALALYGTATAVTGAPVTGEVLPTGLVAGDVVALKNPKVSSITVKDSAGSPATVPGGNYAVDTDSGIITFTNVGSFTQPFKVDYTFATHDRVTMLSAGAVEIWLHFAGLNTADSNKPVLVELYKVRLDPLSDLALINDEFAQMELKGSALSDDTKLGDATLGQFGRILMVG